MTTPPVTPARAWLPTMDKAAIREGVRDIRGPAVGIFVWGLVTGVAMVNQGLSVTASLLMTFTVYAGSAQLATTPLLVAGVPLPVVWVTALLVNLRFVIFAAASRPYVTTLDRRQRWLLGYLNGDLPFALFSRRFGDASERSTAQQHGYLFGMGVVAWAAWQVPSVIGIIAGDAAPERWGLQLAAYLALLCVLLPMLRTPPAIFGVVVTGAVGVVLVGLPLRLGLVISIVCGVAAAMLYDTWRSPRQPAVSDEAAAV